VKKSPERREIQKDGTLEEIDGARTNPGSERREGPVEGRG